MKLKYLILFAIILSLQSISVAQPRMEIVGGDTVNWGQVRYDQSPVTYNLIIRSTGDDTLIIRSINTSCGCTTAPIDKKELLPGDSASMSITFNIPNHPGIAKKMINIRTNDPLSRNRTVYLIADVIFPLKFEPIQLITFHGLVLGDSMTSTIKITNNSDIPVQIKEIVISDSVFTTNLKEDDIIEPHASIEVSVQAVPIRLGALTGELSFKTTHPDVVRVKIPIMMNILGEKVDFQ